MELQVLDKTIPLKAYPEKDLDAILSTQFKYWLSNLLGIKAEKENDMDNALTVIKKKFWSLGLSDIKKAFESYALGELDIKPISNHIDIILVGQIFNAYKKTQRTKPEKFDEQKYKEEQDKLYLESAFEYYESSKKLPEESVWLYDYLETTLGKVNFSESMKKEIYEKHLEEHSQEEAIIKSKIDLLKNFFDDIISKSTHIKHLIN